MLIAGWFRAGRSSVGRHACVVMIASLIGCAATGVRAPDVVLGSDPSPALQEAARGRAIMLAECRECHSLVSPTSLSRGRWEEILPAMFRKADVSEMEAHAIRAYLDYARADTGLAR